jgi:hypothetical protein
LALFDFEKICKKQTDKIKLMFGLFESEDKSTNKFIKFVDWWGIKFTPFLLTVATFITTAWIFNTIQTKYGIEKLVIIIALIFMFILNSIDNKLKKLTEPDA